MLYNAGDITGFVTDLAQQTAFRKRDDLIADRRRWLYGEHQVDIGTGTKIQYRPPDLAYDGNQFKNRMLAAPVRVQVTATRESGRATKKAQSLENFFRRHYFHWREQGVFDPVLFDMATQGAGWTLLRLNHDALPLLPEYEDESEYMEKAQEQIKRFTQTGSGDLFVAEHIAPDAVYYSPDKRIRCYRAEVPYAQLRNEYSKRGTRIERDQQGLRITSLAEGETVDAHPFLWNQTVTVYIVETEDYCYHVASGVQGQKDGKQLLATYRNYFGRPALFYTYAERTGSSDPSLAWLPLIWGKYQTEPLKAKLVTGLVNAGLDASQMRMTLEPIPGWTEPRDELEGNVQLGVTEDGTVIPPHGYRLVPQRMETGIDLEKSIQLIQALDTFGYRNPEEIKASSGYDRAQVQDQIFSQLNPPLEHFGGMLAQMFLGMAHAIGELDTDVSVQNIYTPDGRKSVGETIVVRPSDVTDIDIAVSFNSVTQFSRIAMQEEGMKLLQAKLMTRREFISDVRGIDDPEAWQLQYMEDQVAEAATDRAITDVMAAIDQLRGVVVDEAMLQTATAPLAPTNEDILRSDRGPSMPIGTGQAMPLMPTPPGMGEEMMPV